MIDALHLFWIIPLSASIGWAVACIMMAAKKESQHSEDCGPKYCDDPDRYRDTV